MCNQRTVTMLTVGRFNFAWVIYASLTPHSIYWHDMPKIGTRVQLCPCSRYQHEGQERIKLVRYPWHTGGTVKGLGWANLGDPWLQGGSGPECTVLELGFGKYIRLIGYDVVIEGGPLMFLPDVPDEVLCHKLHPFQLPCQ